MNIRKQKGKYLVYENRCFWKGENADGDKKE